MHLNFYVGRVKWYLLLNKRLIMVQLMSKFTAYVSQHVYLTRFFARHDELHVFHT